MKVNPISAFGEGFRIIAREPLTVLGWALAILLNSILLIVVMVGLLLAIGLGAGGLQSLQQGQFPSGAVGGMVLAGLLLLLLVCLFYGVISAAIYRAVLDPGGSRAWARLRIGGAEFRLALNLVIMALIWLVWYLLTALVVGIFIGVGGRSGAGLLLGIPAGVFSMLAFFSLFAFAGPMTLDRGGIQTFGGVGAAAGNFWGLVVMNLLLCLLAIGLYVVIAVVVVSLIFGGNFSALASGDPTAMTRSMMGMYTSPFYYLFQLTLGPVISAVVQVIFSAPAARAYADAVGGKASQQAEAFS